MTFKSKFMEEITELSRRLGELYKLAEAEKQEWVAVKTAEGWQPFTFFSEYYGSHPEYGEHDEEQTYLFAPTVDITRWKGIRFAHGHHGQNDENEVFSEWLESLGEDQYIEV